MDEHPRRESLLIDSLRAHALRFEAPLAPAYGDAAGMRMLIAFVAVGVGLFVGLRFALAAMGARGAGFNLAFVMALLVAFVVAQRAFIRLPAASVGLRRYSTWTRRERLYVAQVAPLAAVAFALVFRDHLRTLLALHGVAGFLVFSVVTGILWGVVQEFLYRGWLQTELTRRFGTIAGLIAANVVFTFGPLHLDYFLGPNDVRWAGLAAIFGIGLLFGVVYARSGNLWIPAVLHGLWPPNMS
jgi:membrane protease YdiL (CAAX protease family)